jgi:ATP-binding cassette subfamily B protein/ATP-binding cassette subfamily C protein
LIARYWKLLQRYLWPQRIQVLLLAVAITGQIGLQLVNPQILAAFIDAAAAVVDASEPDVLQHLTTAALLYLGLAAVSQTLSLVATYLGENVAWTATNALRHDLTAHSLRLDMSFHKTHTSGDLIQRLDGDVTTLANFFSQMTIRALGNGLLALGILAVLFYEDWRIGLVSAAYACLMATALRALQKAAVAAWRDSRHAESEWSGYLGERLVATEDIRGNGIEAYVMLGLYRIMRAVSRAWRRAKMMQGLSRATGSVAFLLTYIAALAIAAELYLRGEMSIGTVYVVIAYISRLRAQLVEIRGQVDSLQRASASVARVEALFRAQSRLCENVRTSLPVGPLRVAFDDVAFRYDDGMGEVERGQVLDDISFVLEPGKVLGLLGRTGSGKTTLSRLIFRLYDPSRGEIRLGDVDLVDVGLSDVRQRVGLVTQDVQLFRDSVRRNLTMFNQRVQDARILDAFRELGLWEWYRSLPDGLDTVLQAGASSLSAGEAQLLAFTRVFLRDPGLIVLDEASSRLDPATEQLLERAVDRLLHDRTAIVIAHRLSTVDRADEIMILNDGCIGEYGIRQALATDPSSRFYSLLQDGLKEVLA